jgi:pilus assembly protein CpaE
VFAIAVGLVIETKAIWDELTAALQEMSVRTVFELSEIPSDWPAFMDRIERLRPDVVLLEVTKLKEPLDQVVARIQSAPNHPAVYALHTEADPAAILTALRAGASEYIFSPLREPLQAAFERLGQTRQKTAEGRNPAGKTIAFVSAKGGCGATTVACHVAVELPRFVKSKVLLADLDLQAGSIGFLVKSKTPYSIADAASNLQRLDPSYWRALISNGIPDLEIITAPSSLAAKQISPQQMKQVVAFARTQYSWTVLDMGRNLNAWTLGTLDLIDETYLVTTHEVPALHQAKQMIQILLDAGYPQAKLRLLLNRVPKHSDVTIEELESMLGLPVFGTLVNDYQALQEAYAEGGLVDNGSHLGRSFSRLAMKIAGASPEKKKKFSLFS